jgi:hypothetical protein
MVHGSWFMVHGSWFMAFFYRPLEEHSFSSNSGADGTPTPQEKMAKSVGWAEEPVLAIALQELL